MTDNELFVTIETGGSIGEIANNGRYRVIGKVFENKDEAKKQTRYYSSKWGGGYYGYKYSTKTVAWAKANCEKFEK